jgi:DNA polymerase III delta subunit
MQIAYFYAMPSIFILTGGHIPNKEARIRKIIEEKLPAASRQQALEVYHAEELPTEELIEKLSTGSLFGGDSLILVRGCESLKSETLEEIAPLLNGPESTTTLILEGKSIGTKLSDKHPFKKLMTKSSSAISSEIFTVPPDYEIPAWIITEAEKRFNRKIDKKAAETLLERVGNELHTLITELTKLDIVLPPKQQVSEKAILEYTAVSRACEAWDLPAPIARREADAALQILKNLFAFNVHAIQIVSALFDHFHRLLLMQIWFAEHEGSLANAQKLEKEGMRSKNAFSDLLAKVANESGFSGRTTITPRSVYPRIVIPKVLQQITNYSIKDLNYCLRLLTTADWELKTGGKFSNTLPSMERLVLLLLYANRFKTETRF